MKKHSRLAIAGLIIAQLISAHTGAYAETLTFPCGATGQTYSVTLPEGILSDGQECTGSVVIDKSVKIIGEAAFAYDLGLNTVTIPDSVTEILDNAFGDTSIYSVKLGNAIKVIKYRAFYNTKITSIEIPNSVISIGDEAFAGSDLISLTIPESVTSIGSGAFAGIAIASVVIPESVTTIGAGAFKDNGILTTVSLSDALVTLGDDAFAGTEALTEIEYCGKLTNFPIPAICPPARQAVIDAKIAAEKAAAEKAAADLLASQKPPVAKKVTITCVKGKVIKKLSAVKPKCPAGYKKR